MSALTAKPDAVPACVGKSSLFDSCEPRDHERAATICRTCPVLNWCAERTMRIAASLPADKHLYGTWATRGFRIHTLPLETFNCVTCGNLTLDPDETRGHMSHRVRAYGALGMCASCWGRRSRLVKHAEIPEAARRAHAWFNRLRERGLPVPDDIRDGERLYQRHRNVSRRALARQS